MYIFFRLNTTISESSFQVEQEEAEKIISEAPVGGDVQELSDTGNLIEI